jgi:hypothetical protein
MGVTCETLQKMPCAECGDDRTSCVIVLSPACHKHAATFVKFHKATNSLEVVCSKCDRRVIEIDVPRMS